MIKELQEFIRENKINYRYTDDNKDVVIFLYSFQLDDFLELLNDFTITEGFDCKIINKYIAIFISKILEFSEIELNEIFQKEIK